MDRPRHLFREFGLTLALVLAAVLILWRTTLPSLRKNAELDRRQLDLMDQEERRRAELKRLRARERAFDDPIEIERVQRDQHGELGLPPNERRVPAEEGEAAPAAASSSRRRP
jgi:hypothetical protein